MAAALKRRVDELLIREPGEVGFFEAVKLVQERVQLAGELDEAGRESLEKGEAAEARSRFEDGVELVEFAQGKEASMWRVVLRDKGKTAAIYAEASVTSRVLGERRPGDRVNVEFSKGDWVRLNADECSGEESAWMLINRSGAAKGYGVMLEPEVSAGLRERARELYLSARLSAARACLAMEDATHAALHATAALLFDEGSDEALLLRAVANISLDSETRIEEARDDLERLLQKQPDNEELRGYLQKAKERLGEEQQEQELRRAEDAKRQLEEEARQRDLREVQALRREFQQKATERRRVEEEEEEQARALQEEDDVAQAALALAAAPKPLPTSSLIPEPEESQGDPLARLAQAARRASAKPKAKPAAAAPIEDRPAPEARPSRAEDIAAAPGSGALVPLTGSLGLRSRGLGARGGRGLFGRGRGLAAPERKPEPPPPQEPVEEPAYVPASSSSQSRGAPLRITEDAQAPDVDRGVWRRVLARAKRDPVRNRAPEGSLLFSLRKELRQLARKKAKAVEEEDFKLAKELKLRHTEVSARLQQEEERLREEASSRLAEVKEEVRSLECQVREASEAGDHDRALEIRQVRDRLKAECRRLEWEQGQ